MGASFIHGHSKRHPVSRLAAEAGLKTHVVDWDDDGIFDSSGSEFSSDETDQFEFDWGKTMANASKLRKGVRRERKAAGHGSRIDMSLGEAVQQTMDTLGFDKAYQNRLLSMAHHEIELDYGTTLDNMSLLFWDNDEEIKGPDAMIVGGYHQIINHIIAKGNLADCIRARTNVTRVVAIDRAGEPLEDGDEMSNSVAGDSSSSSSSSYSDDYSSSSSSSSSSQAGSIPGDGLTHSRVLVRAESDSEPEEFECDAVICTLPLGVLKARATSYFQPSLSPAKLGSIEAMGVGLLAKVVFIFDKCFWPTKVHAFSVVGTNADDRQTFPSFIPINKANGGKPALLSFLSGEMAYRAELMSSKDLISMAMPVLRTVFGRKKACKPTQTFVTRWSTDPASLGGYSYTAVGASPDDIVELGRPEWNGRVHFAGEHTHVKYPSTVHGAILSGEHAANAVAKQLLVRLEDESNT